MYQKKSKNDVLKIISIAALISSFLFVLLRWSCEMRVDSLDVKVPYSTIERLKKERIESKE